MHFVVPLARYLGDHIEGEVLGMYGEKKNVYVVLVRNPEGKTTWEV